MTKEVNRKQLYNLVWSKPMNTLAKDYGLSGRGLAKLCQRNNIPVPPRGYWAKRAAGQKVQKAPLPVLDNPEPDTAILLKETKPAETAAAASRKKEESVLPASIQEALDKERLPENRIKVPATMHNPHPIIDRRIKAEKREAAFDKKYGGTSFRSPVTPLQRREWRIRSTLFRALEQRGFKISEGEKNHYSHKDLCICFADDKVSFHIREYIKQSRRNLTDKEKEENFRYAPEQKWTNTYDPTGTLEIILFPGEESYSKIKIREDDNKPFEEKLNEVVIKIIEMMWCAQSNRLAREEKERLWRQEEQARYLRQQAVANEQKRKDHLERKAFAWKRAQLIREYITAVEQAQQQGQLDIDDAELGQWRRWAIGHADSMDFIVNGNPLTSLEGTPEEIGGGMRLVDDSACDSSAPWFPGKKWYQG